MKNEFRVDGDITTIFTKRRNGKIIETIIDTEDLERLMAIPIRWNSDSTHGYIRGTLPKSMGKKRLRLHRFLVEAPDGLVVDHINHNILDNRKSNLRIVTAAINSQNRKGASTRNKTGHLCVTRNENGKGFQVRVKRKYLGTFDNLNQAIEVATFARATIFPFSKEAKLISPEAKMVNPIIRSSARKRTKKHIPCINWHSKYNRWQVRITENGKRKHLGWFKEKQEAEEFVCKLSF